MNQCTIDLAAYLLYINNESTKGADASVVDVDLMHTFNRAHSKAILIYSRVRTVFYYVTEFQGFPACICVEKLLDLVLD